MVMAATIILACSCNENEGNTDLTIRFNGLLDTPETEYVGPKTNLPDGAYYYESTFTDPTGTATFTHYVPTAGNYFGGGFTYTNKTDVQTNSYTNSSAITGGGQAGDTYLTCNADGTYRHAIITLKNAATVKGAYFTNSTYAYLTIRDGGMGARPFETGDWFKVIVTGKMGNATTGTVDVYLAKDGNICNQWMWQDLSTLGMVDALEFSFDSTDKTSYDGGQTYYLNTPTYFCMDGMVITL